MRYLIFLFFLSALLSARTIVVGDCERALINTDTIEEALSRSIDGDTIKICPGTYNEGKLEIKKNYLTITSTSGDASDVTVENTGRYHIFKVTSTITGLTMSDLTLKQNYDGGTKAAVYFDKDTSNATFEDLNITSDEDHKFDGIYFKKNCSGDLNIQDVNITNAKDGVYFRDNTTAENIDIQNSRFEVRLKGVYVSYTSKVNIKNSTVSSYDGRGIYFLKNSGELQVEECNISAKNEALYSEGTFENVTVKQTVMTSKEKSTVLLENDLRDTFTVSGCEFKASDNGVKFQAAVKHLKMEDTNITVTSTVDGKGVNVVSSLNDANITGVDINSTYEAIYVNTASDSFILKNSRLKSSRGRGVYFENSMQDIDIEDNRIWAKDDALRMGGDVNGDFALKENCLFSTDAYGFNIQGHLKGRVDISGNCLFADKGGDYLAKSEYDTVTCSGNYWHGVRGSYDKNNVKDDDILYHCKHDCGPCLQYNGPLTPIEFEGGEVTLSNTYDEPGKWDHVTFMHEFSTVPVVFMVISTYGSDPASVRIKNVTKTGFDVTIVEPPPQDGPHVEQVLNYLAINTGVHELDGTYIEVGTIDTRKVQGRYAPVGNDVGWAEVETDVKYCNAAVVSNIQTLNNLEDGKDPPKTDLVPWGTAVLKIVDSDTIDLAIEMSETDEGVFTQNETVAYMLGDANFTGKFTAQGDKEVKFEILKTGPKFEGWNKCRKVDFQNSYDKKPVIAGWKDSRLGGDGGWFRKCYLDEKQVGFVVDEDKDHDSERNHIPEIGAVFAFSDIFVKNDVSKNYKFDAWNDDHNISDRNITTKISSKEFNITIASLTEDGSDFQEFNGTVCTRVVSDGYEGEWNKTYWENETEKNVTFNVNRALKEAYVYIQWISDENTDCPVNDKDGETNSTDNFAIRPQRFDISKVSGVLKAGNEFNLTIEALDASGADTKDYNESVHIRGSSADLEYNETKSGCKTGTLSKTGGGDFSDGKTDISLKYDEVGEIEFTVKEVSGSEFASVDSDDTPESERFIASSSKKVNISVDHFGLSALYENYDTENNFTYYDEALEIASHMELNITAEDKDGNTAENYNKDCYAKDVNISLSHTDVDVDVSKIVFKYVDTSSDEHEKNVSKDENITFVYEKDNFTTDDNGSTSVDIYINFDRNLSEPVNPFEFNITRADVNDTDSNGSVDIDESAVYYYGNVIFKDILAVEDSIKKTYRFAVFDDNESDSLIPNEKELRFNWYYNTLHDAKDGNVSDSEIKISRDLNASHTISGVDVSVENIGDGDITFKIKRNDSGVKYAVVHLLSPNLRWLWYSKFGEEYNVSDDSTCLNHFCFSVSWQDITNKGEAGSGVFEGTESNVTESNTTKRGVKIFR